MPNTLSVAPTPDLVNWVDQNLPGDDMFTDPRWQPVEIAEGLFIMDWQPVTPLTSARWMRRAMLAGSLLVSFAVTFLPLVVLS